MFIIVPGIPHVYHWSHHPWPEWEDGDYSWTNRTGIFCACILVSNMYSYLWYVEKFTLSKRGLVKYGEGELRRFWGWSSSWYMKCIGGHLYCSPVLFLKKRGVTCLISGIIQIFLFSQAIIRGGWGNLFCQSWKAEVTYFVQGKYWVVPYFVLWKKGGSPILYLVKT